MRAIASIGAGPANPLANLNAESLDVKSLNSLQENLVREVTTMFFARRLLLASLLLSPPQDDEELFYELMRLDELTATVDALTGGAFGKRAWRWDEEEKPARGMNELKELKHPLPLPEAPTRQAKKKIQLGRPY